MTKCKSCGQVEPNWWIYRARRKADGLIVEPLCAHCIRGDRGDNNTIYSTTDWVSENTNTTFAEAVGMVKCSCCNGFGYVKKLRT